MSRKRVDVRKMLIDRAVAIENGVLEWVPESPGPGECCLVLGYDHEVDPEYGSESIHHAFLSTLPDTVLTQHLGMEASTYNDDHLLNAEQAAFTLRYVAGVHALAAPSYSDFPGDDIA